MGVALLAGGGGTFANWYDEATVPGAPRPGPVRPAGSRAARRLRRLPARPGRGP
ncbi:SipW-dependent-type signal peptide-containing protein [Georgenia sp. SUBG003]|uniref:SipW-dependent-type signal peptide-containing protein n=1 Tax=Georgenia sp. SUBG003 TaxID=1497974 RepID=UPI003AB6F776